MFKNIFNNFAGYFGYSDNNGFHHVGRGFKLVRISINIETDIIYLTLQTRFMGMTPMIQLPKGDFTKRNLGVLANKGFDVNESNFSIFLKALQNEIERYHGLNYTLAFMHSNLGWHFRKLNDEYVFKSYNRIGSSPSTYLGSLDIKPRGSLENEIAMYKKEVIGNTALESILAISAGAMVNGFIGKTVNTQTSIFHIYADSSQGKSTAAKLAVSLYGNPDIQRQGLAMSWSGTHNAIITRMKGNYGMCVAFDELSKTHQDLSSLVYELSDGREKERCDRDASLKKLNFYDCWQTFIVSTGEASLLSKCKNNTGLKARVFEFTGAFTTSAKNADSILKTISKNYGNIAPLMADTIVKRGVDYLVNLFYDYRGLLIESCESGALTERICSQFALALVGGEIFNETLELELNLDNIFQYFTRYINESSPSRDMAEQAYERILEEVSRRRSEFIDGTANDKYIRQCLGKLEFSEDHQRITKVIFYHSAFCSMLNMVGYEDENVVIKKLKENGYLDCESGKNYNRRKIRADESSKTKVIILKIKPEQKIRFIKPNQVKIDDFKEISVTEDVFNDKDSDKDNQKGDNAA